MVLTLDGLGVEYHMGSTGGIDYVQLSARLRNAQARDWMYWMRLREEPICSDEIQNHHVTM